MDLTDYLTRFGNLDPDTARAASKYLRKQSDRLARLAADLELCECINEWRERGPDDPPLRPCATLARPAHHPSNATANMIQYAARGWTNAQIGAKFGLSEDYVWKIVKAAFSGKNGPSTR